MATRAFNVSGANITVAGGGVNTLVFINPAAAPNFGIRILRAWVNQSSTTTAAMVRVQFHSQVTAFPTLTAATPAKLQRQDPNVSIITGGTAGAAGTCGINASAEGAGTKTVIYEYAVNNQIGWEWVPTPKEVLEFPAGSTSGFGLAFAATVGTTAGWDFGVTFEEF